MTAEGFTDSDRTKLSLSGGTMTGTLILDDASPAASQHYVATHGGGGGGGGSVVSVAGVDPDDDGNVPLTPADIGAALASDLTALAAGLGTAAAENSTAFDPSGAAATALSTALAAITSAITALNLGTASTQSIAAFDAAGSATTAQGFAIQRSHHTGTQLASTISDFATAAAADAPVQSVAGKAGAVSLVKGDVGLGSVDNTADASKPVSTAQQAALDLKANLASPTFTGTVAGITKSMVGLGSVDNTADASKPVSTAQQAALDLKANLASPTFTGTVAGITKSMVGLGNVDNTADTAKPVSTAQQTALDLKANLASPSFTGTISNGGRIVDTPHALSVSSSHVATDASTGNHFRVSCTAAFTLDNPSNATDGQAILWELVQDGTGTRVMTLDTTFAFGTDITAAVLSTAANKRDFLLAKYVSSLTKWLVIAFVRGY